MHKLIQCPEKPVEHLDCVISTTGICNSSNPSKFLTRFWEKLVGKMWLEKVKKVEHLDYVLN
jgi:hypothetical protein